LHPTRTLRFERTYLEVAEHRFRIAGIRIFHRYPAFVLGFIGSF